MSNPRYVMAHGRRIAVETLDIDPPAGKAPHQKNKHAKFSVVELDWIADMAKATGCPCAAILVVMHYLAWKASSQTFAFPNTLLTRYGIDRRIKYWVLENLEAAGKIRIERRGPGQAPIVTLLPPL